MADDMEDSDMAVPSPLRSVLQLHQERVAEYRKLDTAFKLLLQTTNAVLFQKQCEEITAAFTRISTEIRAHEATIRASQPVVADLIRQLQLAEGEKLQLTAQFHVSFQLWHRVRMQAMVEELFDPSEVDLDDGPDSSLIEFVPESAIQARNKSNQLTLQLHAIADRINEHVQALQAELAQELAD